MELRPIPEMIDGFPNFCGAEAQVEQVTGARQPVYLHGTDLRLDRLRAAFAVALHMHQPLIPAGGPDLRTAEVISNLDHMVRNPGIADSHNAPVFAECYARTGDLITELVAAGRSPRVMLDYSGELLYGLRKMGRGDVLDRLRGITCETRTCGGTRSGWARCGATRWPRPRPPQTSCCTFAPGSSSSRPSLAGRPSAGSAGSRPRRWTCPTTPTSRSNTSKP